MACARPSRPACCHAASMRGPVFGKRRGATRTAADVDASLAFFWFLANYFTEGRHWFDLVLSLEAVRGTPTEATILGMGWIPGRFHG